MKSRDILNEFGTLATRAQVKKGLEFLYSHRKHSRRVESFYDSLRRRLDPDKPFNRFRTKNALVRTILNEYFAYFRAVFNETLPAQGAEEQLTESLRDRLGYDERKLSSLRIRCLKEQPSVLGRQPEVLDLIEFDLVGRLRLEGFYFLGGITIPYRGPYVYERQERVEFQVELPLLEMPVTVIFMHDFHSLGWLDFATLGLRRTGGWSKPEALYCVDSAWDRKSEAFLVNFLKHEAQHQYDCSRFPQIAEGHQDILEYRAKLAELSFTTDPKHLGRLLASADLNSRAPHCQAAFRIKKGYEKSVSSRLDKLKPHDVNNIARILYAESNRELLGGDDLPKYDGW